MEAPAIELNIGLALLMLISFVIVGSVAVHLALGLINLLRIRAKKKPSSDKMYLFFYIALHFYLLQILRPIVETTEMEWLLPLAIIFCGVMFIISKEVFTNLIAHLLITLFRPYKRGDIIEIGTQIGEVRSSNLLFSKLKIHPGKELLIANKNILRRIIHNSSYDNLQRHTINFQLQNTADLKGVANAILLTISGYPSLNRAPKPCFYFNELNNTNTMATLYFWSSIANSSIFSNRIFQIIKKRIAIHNKKPRFFSRDFEIIKN